MTSSAAAKAYYRSTDYYASCPGDWLGKGAEMLGLVGADDQMHFFSLADNLDPRTGMPLRPHAKEGDRVGMDLTFNSTKSVGIARELAGPDNKGDPQIEEAHREAVAYAMGFVEADMQTRVRAGGADHDRVTGNMVAYRVTHRDTRINADDQKPDMSLHDHVFVFNTTFDPVEDKWKACQMGQIKHDAPYYEAIFHNRLASNLRDLGYGVRRKDKAFEIAGITDELVKKFSRRSEYIKSVAAKLGITNPESKDKLGATTRLGKAKELADDLNGYYVSRLTNEEKERLAHLEFEPSYTCTDEKAVRYAIGHEFERRSVVEERKLYETALRHGIGSVTVEGVQDEAKRQGMLVKDRDATTKGVLEEESRIIAFAREGKGTMRPLHNFGARNVSGLSREQANMVYHVLCSTDQAVLVIGDAGTGKTHAIKAAIQAFDRPIEMLAPSADASRGVLREAGFSKADTVASFLMDPKRQAGIKNGVIWVDEAGLLPIKDLSRLTEIATQQNARIVLQGDPKQHHAVVRHGNMMNVLQEYAGLPVGRLTEIWRQKHQGYKRIVADIAAGDRSGAFDGLNYLGWVQKVDGNAPLVDDYMAGLRSGKDQLVIAPTHAEADEITAAIRARLKEDGKIGEDHEVKQLVNLNWTAAEKDDRERYDGSEVLMFHRNSGSFRAGQVVPMKDWKPGTAWKSGEHFSVYREDKLAVAAGDMIRITANGKTQDGHKLNNGSVYRVKGFDKHGSLVLGNGWTVGPEFRHLNHGYVSTSPGSQGKTVDRVLVAMGSESRAAMNAEQFYVSVSRGRESARVYTDMATEELKKAIERTDQRRSATELLKPKRKLSRVKKLIERVKKTYSILREKAVAANREMSKQPEQAKEMVRGR